MGTGFVAANFVQKSRANMYKTCGEGDLRTASGDTRVALLRGADECVRPYTPKIPYTPKTKNAEIY